MAKFVFLNSKGSTEMIKLFYQGVIAALMVSDTSSAITLLQDNQAIFLDPLSGANLQAEILYCAIKQANAEVIRFLAKIGSSRLDIPFYTYCGATPLSLALQEGLNDVIPNLLPKADKYFSLSMAVKFQNGPLVELLLKTFTFKDKFLHFLGLR
jgi:ankyrin repeat protein